MSAGPPLPPPLSHDSASGSTGPSQTINRNQNAHLSHSGQPPSHSLPPPRHDVLVSTTAPDQATGAFVINATNIMVPDVPIYDNLFLQWLHARRSWMINQGCNDPFLVGHSFLAQVFDRWLQQWWPLFHSLRIGTPETNPSSWISIFDFWFIALSTEHTPSPSQPQTIPTNSNVPPMDTYQAPEQGIAGPSSTSLASQNKKHYRSEMSTLTVQQIQDACFEVGGEADAIQRLAAVFPPVGVITRDALKVSRRPRVNHRGYQEFSGQVDGRWYCRLCKRIGGRTWKNEKDILNHIWNEHCDPPPSR